MRRLVERWGRGARTLAVAVACLGVMSPLAFGRQDGSVRDGSVGGTSDGVFSRAFWHQASTRGPVISAVGLPPEAVRLLAAIRDGGPFRYDKDGVTFGNRERLLPRKPRGYYREYTVPTPRARDRGARRIVCGGPARTTDECYYTDDHYNSFKRIQG